MQCVYFSITILTVEMLTLMKCTKVLTLVFILNQAKYVYIYFHVCTHSSFEVCFAEINWTWIPNLFTSLFKVWLRNSPKIIIKSTSDEHWANYLGNRSTLYGIWGNKPPAVYNKTQGFEVEVYSNFSKICPKKPLKKIFWENKWRFIWIFCMCCGGLIKNAWPSIPENLRQKQ